LDEVITKWLKKLKTSKYFKELIFNTLLFAYDQFIISDKEDNLQRAVHSLYVYKKNTIWKFAKKHEGFWFRWD